EKMGMMQELEWIEAQKIEISKDLVAAAKQQLLFLATVDRNRWLYEGPGLQRAIYRYNAFWLPLLAKASESSVLEGPLVVPLDCEWIWHCHRLNPVQYKSDCEQFYGRILDNCNVLSTIQKISCKETEEIWNQLYPEEPYVIDASRALSEDISDKLSATKNFSKYDFVSAVKRQAPFFYQVSRPHMSNDIFLQEAVARYKGFLHIIKRNKERSLKSFTVPTYDVDIIWHSHQLHPVSYCKDLTQLLGNVLEHDDTDSDRSEGQKLDVGFSGTTERWEESFGLRYWRAGAMYRGLAPTPITKTPILPNEVNKKEVVFVEHGTMIQLGKLNFIEVLLEIVAVSNLPVRHKESHFVVFSKKESDALFDVKRRLNILSVSGTKQVACFQCEPTGELLLELVFHSQSSLPLPRPYKTLGFTSISLLELLEPANKLSIEKWLDLVPSSGTVSSKPIRLRVAISCTVPAPSLRELHMVRPRSAKASCFFPLPGRFQHAKSWIRIVDEIGAEVISLQMSNYHLHVLNKVEPLACRDSQVSNERSINFLKKEVIGVTTTGQLQTLAECKEDGWSLMNSLWSFQLLKKSSKDGSIFELIGNKMVRLFPGRKLEYELKHYEKQRVEMEFMTAVEFSAEDPYGKAVALFNLKTGYLKIRDEWMMLPGIILGFILDDIFRKEGYGIFIMGSGNLEEMDTVTVETNGSLVEGEPNKDADGSVANGETTTLNAIGREVALQDEVVKSHEVMQAQDSEGYGSEFHNAPACGGCGGCGSNSGGNKEKSAACGGCGGCGGCGSGCGGSCHGILFGTSAAVNGATKGNSTGNSVNQYPPVPIDATC
ncbi:Glycine-rich domain-containing protein-like, partial [Dillenia turbinata]